MTRPIAPDPPFGEVGWDAPMRDAIDRVFRAPWIPFDGTDLATLEANYPAAENEGCLAAFDHASYDWVLAFASGGAWKIIPAAPVLAACGGWYGGVTALASGSDTTLTLGVDVRVHPTGAFTRSSSEITAVNGVAGGMVGFSVTANLTSGTNARWSVRAEHWNGSAWNAIAGSERHACVATGTGLDYATAAWSGPVDLAAGNKVRLSGRIQAGTGSPAVSTISQGTQLSIWAAGAV